MLHKFTKLIQSNVFNTEKNDKFEVMSGNQVNYNM